MKIEKINENQLKIFLTKEDMERLNFKITELGTDFEKSRTIFKDIMEQAMEEYNFEFNNVPLMIEAVPIPTDGIMLIVSKVSENYKNQMDFSLVPPSMEIRKFKPSSLIEDIEENVIDDERVTIFAFKSLDDVTKAAVRLNEKYTGTNVLYKYADKYYLVVQNDNKNDSLILDEIDTILCEYGEKIISNIISKYFIAEHGETIIKNQAVEILSSL